MTLEPGEEFEQLLEFLRESRGFDFTGYKRTTLVRRIAKRAQQLRIESFGDYLDHLQVHPDEFGILFNSILINVTESFRDPAAWEYVKTHVIPSLTAKHGDGAIRVWSAGCATGEEAYSIAMLLCDALGPDLYAQRVKVYATDIDDEALGQGRDGYQREVLQNIPPELVEKYLDLQGGRYSFKPALRRTIIFGRHDLMQDAPIGRIDLLICRNTLMYFTAESQQRILSRFHYALNDQGFLFLGRAEMLLTHADLFAPHDLKHRVFRKVPRPQQLDRMPARQEARAAAPSPTTTPAQLQDLAGEMTPVARLVVDAEERLVATTRLARSTFGLTPRDLGRPIKDLELSYRPAELRSRIETALKQRRTGVIKAIEHRRPDGTTLTYDVVVAPLQDADGKLVGASVTFQDMTEINRLQAELDQVRHEVETANEELQSSNEELETTNEELQSTVEELETTNEELQSTNEELETMNEELESTNAELQTINNDLRERTEEVDRLNTFLGAVLTSIESGIAVLDRDLTVLLWNAKALDLWGIREDETVGNNFMELDIGLPRQVLQTHLAAVANGRQDPAVQVVDATNRRGRSFRCRVTMTPLSRLDGSSHGVVVLMEVVGKLDLKEAADG